jgi:LysR family cys regulon transcriptional activator
MKLQQLRYLGEIAKRDLSFSSAADALHTSQPGISKQMRLLEQELGVDVFVRSGNRIIALTEPGTRIVEIATQVLRQTESIKAAATSSRMAKAGASRSPPPSRSPGTCCRACSRLSSAATRKSS